jgi:hypothetical protein
MSRFCFSKIIENPNGAESDVEDLLGYNLSAWMAIGVVGYDDPLNTYFINMEDGWIFGTTDHEIPSIHHLQRVIAALFRGALIPFSEEGLREISVGVESFLAVLSPEQASAESNQVSAEYLSSQVEIANFYRNQ